MTFFSRLFLCVGAVVAQQADVTIPATLQPHFFREDSRSQLVFLAKVHKTNRSLVELLNKLNLISNSHKKLNRLQQIKNTVLIKLNTISVRAWYCIVTIATNVWLHWSWKVPSGVLELSSAGDSAMRKESFEWDCNGVAVLQYRLLSEWIRDWEKWDVDSTGVGLHCGW